MFDSLHISYVYAVTSIITRKPFHVYISNYKIFKRKLIVIVNNKDCLSNIK